MQPSGFRSAQAKENLPAAATPSSSSSSVAAAAPGGPQGPGSAAKGQAELRAQLAAFRERKTKPTPVKAPSGTPMQQQQPLSSASRHQSRGSMQTPSEHKPPLSASRTRGQQQQQQQQRPNVASASARKTSFGREAAGSVEKGKTDLAGKKGDAEGATQVASTPLQQKQQGALPSSDTTPPSGGSTASAASKEKVRVCGGGGGRGPVLHPLFNPLLFRGLECQRRPFPLSAIWSTRTDALSTGAHAGLVHAGALPAALAGAPVAPPQRPGFQEPRTSKGRGAGGVKCRAVKPCR